MTVDTISLVDLGPVIAAVLGPMLAFVAVSMRYQHVDGTKTRDLITNSEKETRDLIERLNKETREEARELIDGIGAELAEHRHDTQESFREVARSLADARERLARIEGRLGIGVPLPGEPDGDAANAA